MVTDGYRVGVDMKKLRERRFNKSVFITLFLLGIFFYFLPGEWIKLEKDSTAYLMGVWRQDVMPVYPFFLNVLKNIFGETLFLNYVVILQSLLAVISTMVFVVVLQKQFRLTGYECILLYLLSMLPFSIYLPECGITHQIMTEGITYALFYLYFTTLLKGIWNLKFHWYLASVFGAILLCLIRSQMIILQVIEILLLGYIVYKRGLGNKVKKIIYTMLALAAGVFIALLSYKFVYSVVGWSMQLQSERAALDENKVEAENEIAEEGGVAENESEPEIVLEATTQIDSLILCRGFFEADPEDEELFEDQMMKEIFRGIYRRLDEGQHLYKYAEPGLYMWEKLVYDKVGIEAYLTIMEYDEQNPGIRSKSAGEIWRELGTKILLKHFDRYIYHTMRLMISSFIAAVFFQIRPIYLLCHFIALFIYLFALFQMIYSARKKVDKRKIEFMAAIFIFIIVLAVVINIVFKGIQRYMVYGMGIFYCALYLLVKDTILLPIWDYLKKDKDK